MLKIEGDWVQLDLSSAEGGGQNRGGPKLRVLEGKLLIATGRMVTVLARAAEGR